MQAPARVRTTLASFWTKVRTDMETKKQLIAVALVALFVATFEVIFFFNKVVPSIQSSVRAMVAPNSPSAMPSVTRARLDAALQVLQENERRLIASNNASTQVYAIMILCLPVLLIAVLVSSSKELRTTSWQSIRWDVGIMSVSIVAFQLYFYFFSIGWEYPNTNQIVSDIAVAYRRNAEETGNYKPVQMDELMRYPVPFLSWVSTQSDAGRLLRDGQAGADWLGITGRAFR